MFTPKDEYNGWPNRETWAFVLWVENDQFTYNEARDLAETYAANSDDALGRLIVTALTDFMYEMRGQAEDTVRAGTGHLLPAETRRAIADAAHDASCALDDIGSVWRIDHKRVGQWARELVDA